MEAMSGGVQLRLKERRFSSTQTPQMAGFLHANVAFLSTSGYTTALGASVYNDRLHLSLSGKRDDFGEYHTPQGGKVPHSDSDSSGFSLMGAYRISDDSHFYARFSQDNAQSSDTLTRFKSNGIWRYTTRPDDEAKRYFIGFKKQELQGFSDLHAQFFGNDLHYDMNTKQEAPNPHITELFRDSEMRGGRFSARREFSPSHQLSLALSHSKTKLSNGVRQWNSTKQSWGSWMSAFGIQRGDLSSTQLQISDAFHYQRASFDLGVGYENIKRDVISNINTARLKILLPEGLLPLIRRQNTHKRDHVFSLRTQASFALHEALEPYIRLSSATRTPYFNEAYGNNPAQGTLIPHRDIKNEKSLNFEAGIDGKIGGFSYDVTFYHQRYKDYIELVQTGYKTLANLPIKRFVNLDKATIWGAEAMARYAFNDSLKLQASYLYTHGENHQDHTPLAFIAPSALALALLCDAPHGFNGGIKQEMIGKQSRVSRVNGEIQTPGYALTHLHLGYRLPKLGALKGIRLRLEVNNLWNKHYREHLNRVSSSVWYLPSEPGQSARISFKTQF